jgi:hypothetical protein
MVTKICTGTKPDGEPCERTLEFTGRTFETLHGDYDCPCCGREITNEELADLAQEARFNLEDEIAADRQLARLEKKWFGF